jgi:hypothetical protein
LLPRARGSAAVSRVRAAGRSATAARASGQLTTALMAGICKACTPANGLAANLGYQMTLVPATARPVARRNQLTDLIDRVDQGAAFTGAGPCLSFNNLWFVAKGQRIDCQQLRLQI